MSVYNENAPYLAESIESLFNQTFNDFEIVCINDGTTEVECLKIMDKAKVDNRFKLYHQDNKGLTRSLNRAFSLSTGRYIARQDSDDLSYPERLAFQNHFLDSNKEIALIGSQVEFISASSKLLWRSRLPKRHKTISKAFKNRNPFVHGSVCITRHAYEQLGGYNESLLTSQDYDFFWRISKYFRVANSDRVLYQQRRHVKSISYRKSHSQYHLTRAIRKSLDTDHVREPFFGSKIVEAEQTRLEGGEDAYFVDKSFAISSFCDGFSLANLLLFVKLVRRYPLRLNSHLQMARAVVVTLVPFSRGWLL